MDADQRNVPLLITTEEVPELRSISSNKQESKSTNTSWCSSLLNLYLMIFVVFSVVFILVSIFHPHPAVPIVHLRSTHLSFSYENNPVWTAVFHVKNTDRDRFVTYKNLSVMMYRGNILLWIVKVSDFTLKSEDGEIIYVKGNIFDVEAAREMEEDAEMKGSMELKVLFVGKIAFYPEGGMWLQHTDMKAICSKVEAKFSFDEGSKVNGTKIPVLSFDGRQYCGIDYLPLQPRDP